MAEVRSVVVELVAPLNLTVPRASQKSPEFLSRDSLQLLGLIAAGTVLLSMLKRHSRLGTPAVAAIAAGSIAAAAVSAAMSHRRRQAREAAIDERVRQSFPASDPAGI
jgi:hypothetical protein